MSYFLLTHLISLKANLCQAQQRDLKTIAPLSHRPIVLTDTIDYRTIGFWQYISS